MPLQLQPVERVQKIEPPEPKARKVQHAAVIVGLFILMGGIVAATVSAAVISHNSGGSKSFWDVFKNLGKYILAGSLIGSGLSIVIALISGLFAEMQKKTSAALEKKGEEATQSRTNKVREIEVRHKDAEREERARIEAEHAAVDKGLLEKLTASGRSIDGRERANSIEKDNMKTAVPAPAVTQAETLKVDDASNKRSRSTTRRHIDKDFEKALHDLQPNKNLNCNRITKNKLEEEIDEQFKVVHPGSLFAFKKYWKECKTTGHTIEEVKAKADFWKYTENEKDKQIYLEILQMIINYLYIKQNIAS